MKINLDSPGDDVQIQILPLIDVIFCILTFFILAALQLTRQQGISIDLPQAATGTPQMREMLVVSINPTGQTFVDKELVDRSQLADRLRVYLQQKPDGRLVLNAPPTAFYNDVIQVLDTMRSVGGDRVALATQPVTSPSPGMPSPEGSPTPGATLTPGVPFDWLNPSSPIPTASPTESGTPSPEGAFPGSWFSPAPTDSPSPESSAPAQ